MSGMTGKAGMTMGYSEGWEGRDDKKDRDDRDGIEGR